MTHNSEAAESHSDLLTFLVTSGLRSAAPSDILVEYKDMFKMKFW